MKTFLFFLLKAPKRVMAIIIVLSIFWGLFALKVKNNNSLEDLVFQNTEDFSFYKDDFIKNFGKDETILIAFHLEPFIGPELFEIIDKMTHQLREAPNVASVMSLTTAYDLHENTNEALAQPVMAHVPDDAKDLEALKNRLLKNPAYRDNIISADGRTAGILVKLIDVGSNDAERRKTVDWIKNKVVKPLEKNSGISFAMAGTPVIQAAVAGAVEDTQEVYTLAVILLIAIILYLSFRSLHGIILPASIIVLSIVWTIGLLVISGKTLNWVTSMIPIILVIASIFETIHVYAHFQHIAKSFIDKKAALLNTMQYVFIPCLLTSLTTVAGFISLIFNDLPPIREFGIYASYGIAIAFILSFTYLPIALYLWEPTESTQSKKQPLLAFGRFFSLINDITTKQRKIIVGITFMMVMPLSFIGIYRIKVETNFMEYFKKGSDIRRDFNFVKKHLNGVPFASIVFECHEPECLKDPDVQRKMSQFQKYLESSIDFVRPLSRNNVKRERTVSKSLSIADLIQYMYRSFSGKTNIPITRNEVAQSLLLVNESEDHEFVKNFINDDASMGCIVVKSLDSLMNSSVARQTNTAIRRYISENFRNSSLKVRLTGIPVLTMDMLNLLVPNQIRSLSIAFFLILGLMICLFKSLKLGIFSLIPNVIPMIMTFGIMGWCDIPLNAATTMVASIAIGLIVDDTIHFLWRFKKEFYMDGSYEQAMFRTLQSSGKAVLLAAIILVVGFSVLCISDFIPYIQIGFLLAFTFFAGVVCELILLPALLVVLKPLRHKIIPVKQKV
jgi:predicted RND superfamily exporter protein